MDVFQEIFEDEESSDKEEIQLDSDNSEGEPDTEEEFDESTPIELWNISNYSNSEQRSSRRLVPLATGTSITKDGVVKSLSASKQLEEIRRKAMEEVKKSPAKNK